MEYYLDDNEAEVIQRQINQAWERKEQKEAEKIQREIDCAWAEYALINGADPWPEFDIIEVEKYVQCEDDTTQPQEPDFLYQKNKKRSARRKASEHAKKRLIMKSENAVKNFKKRYEKDLENLRYHASEELKSRVARCNALEKRANRLQR